jgi:hypothetical protein
MEALAQCQECQNCEFFKKDGSNFGLCNQTGQNKPVKSMDWCVSWKGDQETGVRTLDPVFLRRR